MRQAQGKWAPHAVGAEEEGTTGGWLFPETERAAPPGKTLKEDVSRREEDASGLKTRWRRHRSGKPQSSVPRGPRAERDRSTHTAIPADVNDFERRQNSKRGAPAAATPRGDPGCVGALKWKISSTLRLSLFHLHRTPVKHNDVDEELPESFRRLRGRGQAPPLHLDSVARWAAVGGRSAVAQATLVS